MGKNLWGLDGDGDNFLSCHRFVVTSKCSTDTDNETAPNIRRINCKCV